MGRIVSTRITADTNVVEKLDSSHNFERNPCTFNGLIVSLTDATAPMAANTISVYADNSGTGTTNLIFRTEFEFTPGAGQDTTKQFKFTNGIWCHTGLRVEADGWTNLEIFVLHS